MDNKENFLSGCLFFNVNALSRHLLKLAQKEFNSLNISPAHASLLLLVYDTPGISPKQLSEQLNLTPSTITRFIDALVKKGLLIRKNKGKLAFISASSKGTAIKPEVARSYQRIYQEYTRLLGKETAHNLSYTLMEINHTLKKAL